MSEKSRREAIDEAADEQMQEGKRSGKAWQEREMEMAKQAAHGGDDLREVGGKLLSEAFTGQDAAEILGEAPFEPASDSVLDQPLLVVYQEAKFVAVNDEYHFALADGTDLALGKQVNQGAARKLLRLATNLDSMMKTVIDVVQDGQKVFTMERKGSIGKNTMAITDAAGLEVGEVRQTKRGSRRASFALIAGGQELATMQTGRLHANSGFDIVDAGGELLAYVRRLHEGAFKAMARGGLTRSPDNYVLRVARPLDDPLRTLVVATPMAVDSAVNQSDEGSSLGDVGRMFRRFT